MTNRFRIDFACFFFLFLFSIFVLVYLLLDQLNTGGAGRGGAASAAVQTFVYPNLFE